MTQRVILFLAVLLAFGASISHGFHFDDYAVLHGLPWSAWQTRPLTWLSFRGSVALSAHPALWHLASLLLHVAAVLLLYELLSRLLAPTAALLGAAFFAVHPIQAESVAYVYSRSSLLSAVLCIATVLLWTQGKRWFAVGCFCLALFAKEEAAALPLVILWLERKNLRANFKFMGVMLALSVADGINTLHATRSVAGSGAGFSAGISPWHYLQMQGYVILRYLQLVCIPIGFTIDPDVHASFVMELTAWIGVVVLAVYAARQQKWVLAGLILLLPSSSLFPLADQAADHRMYLPMAAFAGCAGLWLEKLPRAAATLYICVLIGISAQRMSVWSSDQKLWSEAVERAPDKLRPRLQLSRALSGTHALSELTDAEKRFPNNVELEAEKGRVYLELGHPELALAAFGKVLGQNPGDAHALNNRGVALRALGQEEAAKQDFQRALKADRCLAEARQNLGLPACN